MTGQDRFEFDILLCCVLNSDDVECFCLYSGTLQFEEVIKMGSSREHNQLMELMSQLKFDDPINIQFTSVIITYLSK